MINEKKSNTILDLRLCTQTDVKLWDNDLKTQISGSA